MVALIALAPGIVLAPLTTFAAAVLLAAIAPRLEPNYFVLLF